MPRACKVCGHPAREQIDRALATGRRIAAIARDFQISSDSILRHRDSHLAPDLVQAHATLAKPEALDLLSEATGLFERMKAHLKTAEGKKDPKAIALFCGEARRCLELLAKLLGQIETAPTVNVLVLPEWLAIRAAVVAALAPHPEAREAVTKALQKMNGGNRHG